MIFRFGCQMGIFGTKKGESVAIIVDGLSNEHPAFQCFHIDQELDVTLKMSVTH